MTKEFLVGTIKTFVKDNYGKSEVEEPSWDIYALAEWVDKNLPPKIPLYAIIASTLDNDNLEVIDYNLTESEASLVSKTASKDKRNERVFIVKQEAKWL